MSTKTTHILISLVLWGIVLFLGGFALGTRQVKHPFTFEGLNADPDHILDEAFFAQADAFFAAKDKERSLREEAGERSGGRFLASKNGSTYYLHECSGARRIGEANKVWFDTEQQARNSGYRPAKNCDGLMAE